MRRYVKILQYLVNKCQNINVNVQDNGGATPLYLACEIGHIEIVKYLIKGICTRNVNVNIKTKDGYSPILIAMYYCDLSIVQYLIEECGDIVDLTATTNEGFDVYDLAVKANECNDFVLFMIQNFSK
jgi:ankyrin repeat protein